ncbi:MAG: gamma-glutamylcyclotransferase family protein [Pseudomonadales bacterium]
MDKTPAEQILYYAYGSNLHPERLGARIPSSQLMGVAELSGYQLLFHKRGADQSAKCNALYSGNPEHILLGSLFSMAVHEKPILDEIEGAGYVVAEVIVNYSGSRYPAFMYVAEQDYIDDSLLPYQWYKEFVYLGARYMGFPDHYVSRLAEVEAIADADAERHALNERVLNLMRE